MSDLWLPGMPRNGTPARTVRPFEQLGKQIKSMGFDAKLNHDGKERTIAVRFIPNTMRTREACIAAGGDGDGLEVSIAYDEHDSPGTAALACVEKGIEVLREVL
jgi:hypothetical protein